MKSITKKICCLAFTAAMAVSVVGCANTDKTNVGENKTIEGKQDVENKKDAESQKTYSEELSKYFPAVEGTVLKYNGTAEYGHALTVNKVTEDKDKMTVNFKGQIQDMSEGEGPSKEELILETEYVIEETSVKEIQKNEKRRHSQSIIREQVVLQLPIEQGKTWEQNVNIDGKEYTAETKIIEITKDKDDKELVKTETVIEGIEFYPENTYKEVKTFKEGKGLVEFKNTILFPAAYEGDKDAHMEFGYHLFEAEK